MKRAKLLQKHCTDEQLLAFLDSELVPAALGDVTDHLGRCWECRARMRELENCAQELAQLLSDSTFLGSERIEASKRKFLAKARQQHPEPLLPPTFNFSYKFSHSAGIRAVWLAAGLTVAIGAGWLAYNRSQTSPVHDVQEAVRIEAALLKHPVHQRFRLEFAESRPRQSRQTQHLDIWSDQGSHRFASTLREDQGALSYAVWQPVGERRFRYDQVRRLSVPVTEQQPSAQPPLYSIAASRSDVNGLQKRFLAWMSSREWQPLSIAKDFSLFVNQQGVLLQREWKEVDGRAVLVLSARNTEAGGTLTMNLQLDPATKQVHTQELHFESDTASLDLRLGEEAAELIPVSLNRAELFMPDVPLITDVSRQVEPIAPPPHIFTAPAPAALPTLAEMANTEIRVEYELHRLNACVGEQIDMRTTPGALMVSGVVADASRRSQIKAAFDLLKLPAWATVDIKTLDEAAATDKAAGSAISSLPFTQPKTENPVDQNTGKSTRSLPLDESLVQYFSRRPIAEEVAGELPPTSASPTPQEWTALYSSRMVSLSQQAYRESWAIKRLGQRFGDTTPLSEESIWLLEAMLRDHVRELTKATAQVQRLIGPVFESSGSISVNNGHLVSEVQTSWPRVAIDTFRQADQLTRLLFELFASGSTGEQSKDASQSVESILGMLPALQAEMRAAEALHLDQDQTKQARATSESPKQSTQIIESHKEK